MIVGIVRAVDACMGEMCRGWMDCFSLFLSSSSRTGERTPIHTLFSAFALPAPPADPIDGSFWWVTGWSETPMFLGAFPTAVAAGSLLPWSCDRHVKTRV